MSNLDEGLEPSSAEEQMDIMGMSDEDILKMDFSESEAPEEAVASEEELEDEGVEEFDMDDEADEDTEESEEFESPEEVDETEEDSTEEETDEEQEEEESSVDYKSKYEELLAPFRANGKEIKVDNAEDLRRLAQMGVGFNAKMAALKPVRKIAKMLENEGLLEESKINFLIDLSKNDPSAINKLISQSGINPLDIDTQGTDGYKPNTYTVDDKQLELDEALTDLKQSPTVQETLNVVSTKWDEASRRILYDAPSEIHKIDAQIQSGVFDKVMAVVEREKLLGRIPSSVSDLEAYNAVGNRMHASGAFNEAPPAPATKQAPVTKPQDVKRKSRKRAAATTRSKPTKQQSAPTDVLNLSDEEFEKLMPNYI